MTRHGKEPITSIGEGSSSSRDPESVTVGTTQQSGESQEEEITFARQTVEQIEALLSHLGRERAPNRKLYSKSVRSLLESRLEMNNQS